MPRSSTAATQSVYIRPVETLAASGPIRSVDQCRASGQCAGIRIRRSGSDRASDADAPVRRRGWTLPLGHSASRPSPPSSTLDVSVPPDAAGTPRTRIFGPDRAGSRPGWPSRSRHRTASLGSQAISGRGPLELQKLYRLRVGCMCGRRRAPGGGQHGNKALTAVGAHDRLSVPVTAV
jgi:hypothetical protein